MPYANVDQQKRAQRASYDRHRSVVAQRTKAKREKDRAWLDAQKDAPCLDCGGRFPPCVMEFHHRDPATKLGSVANLLLNAGRQRVVDEIAKCDLLCANCHRIREYQPA